KNMLGGPQLTPGDANGAIGQKLYIELINQKIGCYAKPTLLPTCSGTLSGFTALPAATNFLIDPQIIWDTRSRRFFFSMVDFDNTGAYHLVWGFSKGPAPTAAPNRWCTYTNTFDGTYGTNAVPDYPRLGDIKHYILIGVNAFSVPSFTYKGSDVAWAKKPAPGIINVCPSAPVAPCLGVQQNLLNQSGLQTWT